MLISSKATEIAEMIKRQEEICDKVQKVNLYLIRKYKDELLKEFEIDVEQEEIFIKEMNIIRDENIKQGLILSSIFDRIAEKMNKEMPYPWYCYGFGGNK